MQAYSQNGVRQERTNWRDQEISSRHRDWGFNCPAVDLDFLMVEYNLGLPVGLIEYKHFQARQPDIKHPTYRALISLADLSKLPFMVAFYWPGIWAFRVHPHNDEAKKYFRQPYEDFSEEQFVTRLYRMRYLAVGADIAGKLNRIGVPQ